MRGSLKQRYPGSWSIILDLGYEPHPETGKPQRKQKWHTFRGTKKDAQDHLIDLLKAAKDGTYVDGSTITVGEWLTEWFAAAKARFRPSTCVRFEGIITNALLAAPFAGIRLQKLRTTHIEAYYASATVSASTLTLHHTILHQALRKALRDRLDLQQCRCRRGSQAATDEGEARGGRAAARLDGDRGPCLPAGCPRRRAAACRLLRARARLRRPEGRAVRVDVGERGSRRAARCASSSNC